MKFTGYMGTLVPALLIFGSAQVSRSQVIFDNINGDRGFGQTYAIGFPTRSQDVATGFTSGASLFLDYAELRLFSFPEGGDVRVSILSNLVDNTPGVVLESVLVTPPPAGFPPLHVEFADTTPLQQGTAYWLAITAVSATQRFGWDYVNAQGPLAIDLGELGPADAWSSVSIGGQGAMRLIGVPPAPVPEPSTYGLMGSCLLIGFIVRRRRRKGAE